MSNLATILHKAKFNPQRFSGLKLWLDASDFNTLILSYNTITETISGTIGNNILTATATVAAKIFAGNKIKVGPTDIYTVSSVSTTIITTLETLTATYPTLTSISVGHASQWSDKSGQGSHATQGTSTAQPKYVGNSLGGKSVLAFDGGDTLALPSTLYSIPNGASTLFAVAKRDTEAATSTRIISMNQGAGTFGYYLNFSATVGTVEYLNNTALNVASTGNTNTNYQIITALRSGITQSISINNNTPTTNTNGAGVSGIDRAYIASNNNTDRFLIGAIAEILIYNRALSNAEMARINRYLSTKWVTTIL